MTDHFDYGALAFAVVVAGFLGVTFLGVPALLIVLLFGAMSIVLIQRRVRFERRVWFHERFGHHVAAVEADRREWNPEWGGYSLTPGERPSFGNFMTLASGLRWSHRRREILEFQRDNASVDRVRERAVRLLADYGGNDLGVRDD